MHVFYEGTTIPSSTVAYGRTASSNTKYTLKKPLHEATLACTADVLVGATNWTLVVNKNTSMVQVKLQDGVTNLGTESWQTNLASGVTTLSINGTDLAVTSFVDLGSNGLTFTVSNVEDLGLAGDVTYFNLKAATYTADAYGGRSISQYQLSGTAVSTAAYVEATRLSSTDVGSGKVETSDYDALEGVSRSGTTTVASKADIDEAKALLLSQASVAQAAVEAAIEEAKFAINGYTQTNAFEGVTMSAPAVAIDSEIVVTGVDAGTSAPEYVKVAENTYAVTDMTMASDGVTTLSLGSPLHPATMSVTTPYEDYAGSWNMYVRINYDSVSGAATSASLAFQDIGVTYNNSVSRWEWDGVDNGVVTTPDGKQLWRGGNWGVTRVDGPWGNRVAQGITSFDLGYGFILPVLPLLTGGGRNITHPSGQGILFNIDADVSTLEASITSNFDAAKYSVGDQIASHNRKFYNFKVSGAVYDAEVYPGPVPSTTVLAFNPVVDAYYAVGTPVTSVSYKPPVRLDAALVGDGSVSNAEFAYLDGVTSDIQAQFDALPGTILGNVGKAFDTLGEIQAALGPDAGGDTPLADTIIEQITTNADAIDAENVRALAAEGVNADAIDAENVRALAAEGAIAAVAGAAHPRFSSELTSALGDTLEQATGSTIVIPRMNTEAPTSILVLGETYDVDSVSDTQLPQRLTTLVKLEFSEAVSKVTVFGDIISNVARYDYFLILGITYSWNGQTYTTFGESLPQGAKNADDLAGVSHEIVQVSSSLMSLLDDGNTTFYAFREQKGTTRLGEAGSDANPAAKYSIYKMESDGFTLVTVATTTLTLATPITVDAGVPVASFTPGNLLNAALIGAGSVSNAEFAYLDGVTQPIQAQITANADAIDAENVRALAAEGVNADAIDAENVRALAAEGVNAAAIAAVKSTADGAHPSLHSTTVYTVEEAATSSFVLKVTGTSEPTSVIVLGETYDVNSSSSAMITNSSSGGNVNVDLPNTTEIADNSDFEDSYVRIYQTNAQPFSETDVWDIFKGSTVNLTNDNSSIKIKLGSFFSNYDSDSYVYKTESVIKVSGDYVSGSFTMTVDVPVATLQLESALTSTIPAETAVVESTLLDASLMGDGSVNNAELAHLAGVTQPIQTQITANADAIDAENVRALAAEKVNADAIDAEETRALAAEGVNADAIDAENVRALAAEGLNTAAIAAVASASHPLLHSDEAVTGIGGTGDLGAARGVLLISKWTSFSGSGVSDDIKYDPNFQNLSDDDAEELNDSIFIKNILTDALETAFPTLDVNHLEGMTIELRRREGTDPTTSASVTLGRKSKFDVSRGILYKIDSYVYVDLGLPKSYASAADSNFNDYAFAVNANYEELYPNDEINWIDSINVPANRLPASHIGDGSVNNAELAHLAGVTQPIQTQITANADAIDAENVRALAAEGAIAAVADAAHPRFSSELTSALGDTLEQATGSTIIIPRMNTEAPSHIKVLGETYEVSGADNNTITTMVPLVPSMIASDRGLAQTEKIGIELQGVLAFTNSTIQEMEDNLVAAMNANTLPGYVTLTKEDGQSITAYCSEVLLNVSIHNGNGNVHWLFFDPDISYNPWKEEHGVVVTIEVPAADVTTLTLATPITVDAGVPVESFTPGNLLNAALMGDGSVNNAELAHLAGVTQPIQTQITANADAIDAENVRALAAEGVNADAIDAENVRALAAEGVNADAIAAVASASHPLLTAENRLDAALLETSVPSIQAHSERIYGVATFGNLFATGSRDDTAKLWNASTGELLRTIEGHTDEVRTVAFSGDGATLVTGSYDETAKLWEVASGNLMKTLDVGSKIYSVAMHGTTVATGSKETTKLWTMNANGDYSNVTLQQNRTDCLAFSPDGSLLVTGGTGTGTDAMLWDMNDLTAAATPLSGHHGIVHAVAINGTLVATGSDGIQNDQGYYAGTIKLWNTNGVLVKDIEQGHYYVYSAAFYGTTLATAGHKAKTVKLFDADPTSDTFGDATKTLQLGSDSRGVAFSGSTLVAGLDDGAVKMFSVSNRPFITGEELRHLDGVTQPIQAQITGVASDAQTYADGVGTAANTYADGVGTAAQANSHPLLRSSVAGAMLGHTIEAADSTTLIISRTALEMTHVSVDGATYAVDSYTDTLTASVETHNLGTSTGHSGTNGLLLPVSANPMQIVAAAFENGILPGNVTLTKDGQTTTAHVQSLDTSNINSGFVTVNFTQADVVGWLSASVTVTLEIPGAETDTTTLTLTTPITVDAGVPVALITPGNLLDAALVGDGSVDNAKFAHLAGAASNIQAQLNALPDSIRATILGTAEAAYDTLGEIQAALGPDAGDTVLANTIIEQIADVKTHAETKAGEAESNAKTHAETKAGEAESNAKTHAETKADEAEANAKAHADNAMGQVDLSTRLEIVPVHEDLGGMKFQSVAEGKLTLTIENNPAIDALSAHLASGELFLPATRQQVQHTKTMERFFSQAIQKRQHPFDFLDRVNKKQPIKDFTRNFRSYRGGKCELGMNVWSPPNTVGTGGISDIQCMRIKSYNADNAQINICGSIVYNQGNYTFDETNAFPWGETASGNLPHGPWVPVDWQTTYWVLFPKGNFKLPPRGDYGGDATMVDGTDPGEAVIFRVNRNNAPARNSPPDGNGRKGTEDGNESVGVVMDVVHGTLPKAVRTTGKIWLDKEAVMTKFARREDGDGNVIVTGDDETEVGVTPWTMTTESGDTLNLPMYPSDAAWESSDGDFNLLQTTQRRNIFGTSFGAFGLCYNANLIAAVFNCVNLINERYMRTETDGFVNSGNWDHPGEMPYCHLGRQGAKTPLFAHTRRLVGSYSNINYAHVYVGTFYGDIYQLNKGNVYHQDNMYWGVNQKSVNFSVGGTSYVRSAKPQVKIADRFQYLIDSTGISASMPVSNREWLNAWGNPAFKNRSYTALDIDSFPDGFVGAGDKHIVLELVTQQSPTTGEMPKTPSGKNYCTALYKFVSYWYETEEEVTAAEAAGVTGAKVEPPFDSVTLNMVNNGVEDITMNYAGAYKQFGFGMVTEPRDLSPLCTHVWSNPEGTTNAILSSGLFDANSDKTLPSLADNTLIAAVSLYGDPKSYFILPGGALTENHRTEFAVPEDTQGVYFYELESVNGKMDWQSDFSVKVTSYDGTITTGDIVLENFNRNYGGGDDDFSTTELKSWSYAPGKAGSFTWPGIINTNSNGWGPFYTAFKNAIVAAFSESGETANETMSRVCPGFKVYLYSTGSQSRKVFRIEGLPGTLEFARVDGVDFTQSIGFHRYYQKNSQNKRVTLHESKLVPLADQSTIQNVTGVSQEVSFVQRTVLGDVVCFTDQWFHTDDAGSVGKDTVVPGATIEGIRLGISNPAGYGYAWDGAGTKIGARAMQERNMRGALKDKDGVSIPEGETDWNATNFPDIGELLTDEGATGTGSEYTCRCYDQNGDEINLGIAFEFRGSGVFIVKFFAGEYFEKTSDLRPLFRNQYDRCEI